MSTSTQSRTGKLHYLKRRVNNENMSLRNHLMSIVHDSEVVMQLREFLSNLALFANLRNGNWYSPSFDGHCYFKSTDGHESHWTFSLSRMNLEIARIAASRGAVIVDSTRQGKVFPDSMTATIPIWCSVINAIVFERPFPLPFPPWMSPSIASQINLLLPAMVLSVSPSLRDMIRGLLGPILTLPFRPLWVAPDKDGVLDWSGEGLDEFLDYSYNNSSESSSSSSSSNSNSGSSASSGGDEGIKGEGSTGGVNINSNSSSNISPLEFTPLVLLSCSPARSDNTHSAHHSWKYIQGAGDDEENWSAGLSAELFWKNRDTVLASDDPHVVEETVVRLLGQTQGQTHPTQDIETLLGTAEESLQNSSLREGDTGIMRHTDSSDLHIEGITSNLNIKESVGQDYSQSHSHSDSGSDKSSLPPTPTLTPAITSPVTPVTPAVFSVASAVFSVGSSGILIGAISLLSERGSAIGGARGNARGSAAGASKGGSNGEGGGGGEGGEGESDEGMGECDMIHRLILTSRTAGSSLRGVIIFQPPDASTSTKGRAVPCISNITLPFKPHTSSTPSSSPAHSSLPPSISPSISPSLSPSPLPSLLPTESIPGLILRAGSSKKESSGQSRSLWCEDIIPACLAFYQKHCVDVIRGVGDVGADIGVLESHCDSRVDPGSIRSASVSDTTGGGSAHVDGTCNGSVLIACEDGMLATTIAVALLLAHYHTSFDFKHTLVGSIPLSLPPHTPTAPTHSDTTHNATSNDYLSLSDSSLTLEALTLQQVDTSHTPLLPSLPTVPYLPPTPPPNPTPSLCVSKDSITPPPTVPTLPQSLSKCVSKESIRACLTMLQMHVPLADQLPRRLVKELNMFFSTYKNR